MPGEFHEQRGLAGYSPWGGKELDTTEGLTLLEVQQVRTMKKTQNYEPHSITNIPRDDKNFPDNG